MVQKLGRINGNLVYHDTRISESRIFIGVKKNFNKPLIITDDELIPMYNDDINYNKLSLEEYKCEQFDKIYSNLSLNI